MHSREEPKYTRYSLIHPAWSPISQIHDTPQYGPSEFNVLVLVRPYSMCGVGAVWVWCGFQMWIWYWRGVGVIWMWCGCGCGWCGCLDMGVGLV